MEYGITLSSIGTTGRGDTDRDKISPADATDALLILLVSARMLRSMSARAREVPLRKGEKCHQVLCRGERGGGTRHDGVERRDPTPMKEDGRNDRKR